MEELGEQAIVISLLQYRVQFLQNLQRSGGDNGSENPP